MLVNGNKALDYNNDDDIKKHVKSNITLQTGEILSDLSSTIKNNGPAEPYKFENSTNQEIKTWIQNVGDGAENLSTNKMDKLMNDFDKVISNFKFLFY